MPFWFDQQEATLSPKQARDLPEERLGTRHFMGHPEGQDEVGLLGKVERIWLAAV